MDRAACHVLYVNRNVGQERLIQASRDDTPTEIGSLDWEGDNVRATIQPLLDTFGDVHVCATGAACISKLFELQEESMLDIMPTIVLLDVPSERSPESRTRSSSVSPSTDGSSEDVDIHTPDEDLYGLNLLQKIITESHIRSMSKLIVPIPVIGNPEADASSPNEPMTDGAIEPFARLGAAASNRRLIRKCLDLGAVDVVFTPLSSKCITSLEICAYRAHRDASKEQQAMLEVRQGRKRSWVGISEGMSEEKPFAYLREAMVSGLMKGICRMTDNDDHISRVHLEVSSLRQAEISEAVGKWYFDAHSFTDDELLVAAMDMFRHALSMPELERWRISADQLLSFLVACRSAYNAFVPYHNFRHVVDVLQATFNFLVHIGALAPYPVNGFPQPIPKKSPIASLLNPFEALTLLVTAIGHDVGHPGVNNGFLVTLNAPLAQLYNDRSVLESFHCAAFSQLLRKYWPSVFEDKKMRSLMISSILATDMGLHFDYMKKLGDLQEKLQESNTTDGWNGRQTEEHRALACSLLIKCADISNVARNHATALKWMYILSEEFSRQASMEGELAIQSSLMAQPKQDIESLAKAQLSFMNLFAIPLFQGVADIMPPMKYTVVELESNKSLFELKVQEEKAKQLADENSRLHLPIDGTFSPRTMSFAVVPKEGNQSLNGRLDATDRNANSTPVAHLEIPLPDVDSPEWNRHILPTSPTQATMRSPHVPDTIGEHHEVIGGSTFDAVKDFANSDPFHCRSRGDSYPDGRSFPSAKQRCSETTEGSVSGAFSGDWASQATSATTGKMPMSPSTRGTSIVSGDSVDPGDPITVPGINISSPSLKDSPVTMIEHEKLIPDEDALSSNGGSIGKAEGKTLQKKSSRYRIKNFFFRHKGTSSPTPADSTG
ncbi:Fc.00g112620.m01.CDS01 [Cosmosporella sp. VM-42]